MHADRRSWLGRYALSQALWRTRVALSAAHLSRAYIATLDGRQVRENLEVLQADRAQARLSLVWQSAGLARGDPRDLGEHRLGTRLSGSLDSAQRCASES